MNRKSLQTIAALLVAMGLAPAAYSQKLTDIENIGTRDITGHPLSLNALEKETELGREAASRLEQQATLVADSAIEDYVDRVAQNIARNSDSKFPISIKLIQSTDVNTFALPGGFIYINSGAIHAANNEAELAFEIAQAVGLVADREVTKNPNKTAIMPTMTTMNTPAIVLTGGVAGPALQQSVQSGLSLSLAHFNQSAVTEADLLGLEYLYKAGYDPQAAVTFLQTVEALEALGRKVNPSLSAWPPTAERIKATKKNIQMVLPPRNSNVLNNPEFDLIKARVAALPASVQPSTQPAPALLKPKR